MTDTLRTLIFDQSSCRAHLVHLSKAWQQVVNNNDYPRPVQKVLGELVAASTMLSASLKFEGSLIIQIQGDGPIRLLVAECNSRLGLRATVKLVEGTQIPENAVSKTWSMPQARAYVQLFWTHAIACRVRPPTKALCRLRVPLWLIRLKRTCTAASNWKPALF